MNKVEKINWNEIIESKLDEIREKIKEMLTAVSEGCEGHQKLYLYEDGSLTVLYSASDNEWLEGDLMQVYSLGPAWEFDVWQTDADDKEERTEEIEFFADEAIEYITDYVINER